MAGTDARGPASATKFPPNKRLYAYRRCEHGWSQKELAEQLAASIRRVDGTETGIDELVGYIGRWENGRGWPAVNFQKHLVLVFGVSAAELGLLKPEELERLPAEFLPAHMRGGVTDQMTVHKMEPIVLPTDENSETATRRDDQITSIQATLNSVGLAAGPLLSLDPEDVITAQVNTRSHLRWYWSWEPQELLDRVLGQLVLGVRMLTPAQTDSSDFRALATAVALDALTAARLLFFDLGQRTRAERCFAIAGAAVDHALDHTLAVAVYAHQAFVPGFGGDRVKTDWLLERAEVCLLRAQPSPLLESWFRCVAAELYSLTDRTDQSIRSIEQARDALGNEGENPEWLDWFGHDRYDAFAGNAYLQTGRFELAATHLQRGLDALGTTAAKQRSVLLFDRALCEAPTDAEKALATVGEGCDALVAAPYAAAFSTRIPRLMAALKGTPFAGELDDRVRALPTAAS
jgi:transcriptional regulator with XRE-family HTH domain